MINAANAFFFCAYLRRILMCLRSLLDDVTPKFHVHWYLNLNPQPYHSFGHGRPLFSGEKQRQTAPLRQCIRRVGTVLLHAVTINHATNTYNNAVLSHIHSVSTDTFKKGQLQTCCKLRQHAFGSCQMTEAVLNAFKAERILKYCFWCRRQR